MGRNHEVTSIHPLLDDAGQLSEPGWSRNLVQQYDRSKIKAPKWRIKEWDYYLVLSDSFAGAFTISDDGYIGLQSVSLLTFGEKPWEHTETVLNAFPMGKIGLPSDSSAGSTVYSDKRLQMRFDIEPKIHLRVKRMRIKLNPFLNQTNDFFFLEAVNFNVIHVHLSFGAGFFLLC